MYTMIRQHINVGSYTYICDLYKYGELNNISKEFVMLRNIAVYNTIFFDNDIFFVDKDFITTNEQNKTVYDCIFPIPNEIERFTTNIGKYLQLGNTSPYLLYDENLEEKRIKCDTLRIYFPSIKKRNNDIIVHVNNIINGTNITYYCQPYNKGKINSETEINYSNNVYSEFIDIYIPNIEDLISDNTYFEENTMSCAVGESGKTVETKSSKRTYNPETGNFEDYVKVETKYINSKIISNSGLVRTENNKTYCSTSLFTVPFKLENDIKVYLPKDLSIQINYDAHPVNVLLYPFKTLEADEFIVSDYLRPNSDVFVKAPSISYSGKLVFNDDGKLVFKAEFLSEGKQLTNEEFINQYALINNVTPIPNSDYEFEGYDGIYYSDLYEYEDSGDILDAEQDILDIERKQYKQYQCVYLLQISTDLSFKNNVFISKQSHKDGNLSNKVFRTKEYEIPLFNKWEKKPELLVCRALFMDRYTGYMCFSNACIITDEYYKYLVNYDNTKKLLNKINFIKTDGMEYKFINNIQCVVKKNTNNDTTVSNVNVSPSIVYKPIFYKVQDLQDIKLQLGVTQNVGINLNNYLTKVETFYMNIEGMQLVEHARNEAYVIFKIVTNKFQNKSGTYHISNQDNEYISSGNWTLI